MIITEDEMSQLVVAANGATLSPVTQRILLKLIAEARTVKATATGLHPPHLFEGNTLSECRQCGRPIHMHPRNI